MVQVCFSAVNENMWEAREKDDTPKIKYGKVNTKFCNNNTYVIVKNSFMIYTP